MLNHQQPLPIFLISPSDCDTVRAPNRYSIIKISSTVLKTVFYPFLQDLLSRLTKKMKGFVFLTRRKICSMERRALLVHLLQPSGGEPEPLYFRIPWFPFNPDFFGRALKLYRSLPLLIQSVINATGDGGLSGHCAITHS